MQDNRGQPSLHRIKKVTIPHVLLKGDPCPEARADIELVVGVCFGCHHVSHGVWIIAEGLGIHFLQGCRVSPPDKVDLVSKHQQFVF